LLVVMIAVGITFRSRTPRDACPAFVAELNAVTPLKKEIAPVVFARAVSAIVARVLNKPQGRWCRRQRATKVEVSRVPISTPGSTNAVA